MSSAVLLEHKKLQRFFQVDKLARKRLRGAIDFLKTGDVQLISLFWKEHATLVFHVVENCVLDLEQMYIPHVNAFGKMKRKSFDQEDWTDVFTAMELLLKKCKSSVGEGWQQDGFMELFKKWMLNNNYVFIRMQGFKILLLYTDAYSGVNGLVGPHMEVLKMGINYDPYGGVNVALPKRNVEFVPGWKRDNDNVPEEPVGMLKAMFDFSLEKSVKLNQDEIWNGEKNGDIGKKRFSIWLDLLMKFVFPMLYPRECYRLKLKMEEDTYGFFHHCPGCFQRIVARWIYKLKTMPSLLQVVWENENYTSVVLESLRQRFVYRDAELILDAIRLYHGWITNPELFLPQQGKLRSQFLRSLISHIAALFPCTPNFEKAKYLEIIKAAIELLQTLGHLDMDQEIFAFLRMTVLMIMEEAYATVESTTFEESIIPMASTLFSIWKSGLLANYGMSMEMWAQLANAIHGWSMKTPQINHIGETWITCWKLELLEISKITIDKMLFQSVDLQDRDTRVNTSSLPNASSSRSSTGNNSTSSLNSNLGTPASNKKNIIMLDRLLNIYPPNYIKQLPTDLHIQVVQSIQQVVDLWQSSALSPMAFRDAQVFNQEHQVDQVMLPQKKQRIRPGSILSLFGQWIFPACLKQDTDFVQGRVIALTTLFKLCTCRSEFVLPATFVAKLCKIVYAGITSQQRTVVVTILKFSNQMLTSNLPGINLLLPALVRCVPVLIRESSSFTQGDIKAILSLAFCAVSYTAKYHSISETSWEGHMQECQRAGVPASGLKTIAHFESTCAQPLFHSSDSNRGLRQILSRTMKRILESNIKDTTLHLKCIWGLYLLIVTEVQLEGTKLFDLASLKGWIVAICDSCKSSTMNVSLTALQAISTLSENYIVLNELDTSIISHIVISLSLIAQQQLEVATVEMRRTIKQKDQGTSSIYSGRTTSSGKSLSVENSAKDDVSILGSISKKACMVYDTLRTWIMAKESEILLDSDVCTILFSAIEAALVGTLPLGPWQEKYKIDSAKLSRPSIPTLFLGLQMREQLVKDGHIDCLEAFQNIANAAGDLILHMLHNYKSEHGVNSMSTDDDASGDASEETVLKNQSNTSNFVYMNSSILSVNTSKYEESIITVRNAAGTFRLAVTLPTPSSDENTKFSSLDGHTSALGDELLKDYGSKRCLDKRLVVTAGNEAIVTRGEADKTIIIGRQQDLTAKNFSLSKKVVFHKDDSPADSNRKSRDQTSKVNNVAGLFSIDHDATGIGSIDGESSLLDLFMDSIPLIFSDAGGELSDKTLLGGRYTMDHYNTMQKNENSAVGIVDSVMYPSLSLVDRLVHDDESLAKFKQFVCNDPEISKQERASYKQMCEFVEAWKRFEHSTGDEMISNASAMCWEFFSKESRGYIAFPSSVASDIRSKLQNQEIAHGMFKQAYEHVQSILFEQRLSEYASSFGAPPQMHKFESFNLLEVNVNQYVAYMDQLCKEYHPVYERALPSVIKQGSHHFHASCVFLAQLGIVPIKNINHLRPLTNDPKLARSLKHLDNTPSRETMKIGVLFVGKGQYQQQDILQNSMGTSEYNTFLNGLGTKIDLSTHKAFTGGLDCNPKSLSNGPSTIYYSDTGVEIIYHVVTMMPTIDMDVQQINKKRHVGNDFVHIVWNENYTEYNASTITSKFNDVQIVIHPLQHTHHGMYRIQLFFKEDVPIFGPLLSGMVVSAVQLPSLVRQTAMNANRLCRQRAAIYAPPYPTRTKLIHEISERYSTDYSDHRAVASFCSES